MKRQRWEDIATPAQREEFSVLYQDHSILLKDLNANFGWDPRDSNCHGIARRLGLVSRPRQQRPGHSSVARSLDLDAQEEQLTKELERVRSLKAAKSIRFEWLDDHTLMIHGVGPRFRALEGIPKLGEFLASTKGW